MPGPFSGKTYSRKKGKYAKAYKALGVKNQKELEELVNAPACPVTPRPALQVAEYFWTTDKNGMIFRSGGGTAHFTMYPQGSNENCRHSNQTNTYKMAIKCWVALDPTFYKKVACVPVHFWLVYDKDPGNTLPGCSTIFDTLYQDYPGTWTVSRNVSRRFVVKKHWHIILASNGTNPTQDQDPAKYAGPGPVFQWKHMNKFFKRLGVRTDWKNSATGEVADIKSGALYLVCAPSGGAVVRVGGRFRMYFKSVGNQ
ncbi:capsid protein [Chickpea yellow dwarf virus]|uniref:Capsid protein n=1 Tax=Chickpea yellow dwarf virus TaxID=1568974 RepID=A0A0A0U7L8_9GEMI|nr:capsid protein [Chickpea yellow dwarf virus]AIW42775.1 capsid protein [Chickpea yellow dwarf virus]AIW42779.1 capsid protein [Chickpea yellow dwarf virus]